MSVKEMYMGREMTGATTLAESVYNEMGGDTPLITESQTVKGAVNELKTIEGTEAYDNTATYAVGDYCIYNSTRYKCITAVTTAEDFDSTKWSATTTSNDISELNSSKANKQWTRILNLSITSNTDQTVQVTYPDGYSELLFSVQRADNGRTIGTNIVPRDQFTGGACYVGGSYTIASLAMNGNANEYVNGVFIYSDATHIEVAFNKGNVNLTARVFAR